MPSADFKISGVLICDDCRFETSGKSILIGVYGNELTFPRPGVNFSFYACLVGQARNNFVLNVIASFEPYNKDKTHAVSKEATLELKYDSPTKGTWVDFLLPIQVTPIHFQSSGKLIVKVKGLGEKSWKRLTEKRVIALELPTEP